VLREITQWGPPCQSLLGPYSTRWDSHFPTLDYWLDAALLHSRPHSAIISSVVSSCKGSFDILSLLLSRGELQWSPSNWVAAMSEAAGGGDPRSVALLLSKLPTVLRL
jgi:hypothetical protein